MSVQSTSAAGPAPVRPNRRVGLRRRSGGPPRAAALSFLLVPLAAALAGCGDDLLNPRWTAAPDTALLYSLARPELNLPSGFNFTARRTVLVEAPGATGNWDLALDTREEGLVLLPPGALNINSRARITTLPGLEFDEVREAPTDSTLYSTDEPVPVQDDVVYVIRTDQGADTFGRRCVFYAKMEPVSLDVETGTLRFLYDTNPICNDPRLVPPDDD